MIERIRLLNAFQTARGDLLAQRTTAGHWRGEMSSSPFATASAAAALSVVAKHIKEDARRDAYQQLAVRAVEWLVAGQTSDGGWGDVPSHSPNLAATMLVRAAIQLAGQSQRFADALSLSQRYVDNHGGVVGLKAHLRGDKALLAAVLGASALAGLAAWRDVPAMAFELAWLPRGLRRPLGAADGHVEPIRVGIGQARFFHRWPRNPLTLVFRRLSVGRSLAALAGVQPASGGFLESAAWTGFLLMGLASTGRADRPIARRALGFLLDTVRPNASWPASTNRAVGNTAFAVNALASASGDVGALGCVEWLLTRQRTDTDVLSRTPPGGWASSDGSGAIADVATTAAALMALSILLKSGGSDHRPQIEAAATAGVNWLLAVQNDDGGWPTYFRGQGPDSPDGSSPELTARALRALRTWQYWTTGLTIDESIRRGMAYLASSQQADGCWTARWFGNPHFPGAVNLIYGTSQVVLAFRDLDQTENRLVKRALNWLAATVDPGGGWGGGIGGARGASSIEETAMAVEALLSAANDPSRRHVLETGLEWLVRAVEDGRHAQPTVIGLQPPRFWYQERIYPLAFTVFALGQAVKLLSRHGEPGA